jgi:hypothetical protein
VFDQDYADIAAMLNKSEASCRQLVHCAQARVQQERPRFDVPKDTHRDLLAKFMQAAGNGDRAQYSLFVTPTNSRPCRNLSDSPRDRRRYAQRAI